MSSQEYMRIVGDRVQLIQETVRKEVDLEQYLEKIKETAGPPPSIGLILPQNAVLVNVSSKREVYVTAHAPTRRSIRRVSERNSGEDSLVVSNIALPWVVFGHVFNRINATESAHYKSYIYFANQAPENWESRVAEPCLNNIYPGDCHICLGDALAIPSDMPNHLKVREIENHFWAATFNHDLARDMTPVGGSYRSWAGLTRKNPKFILTDVRWNRNSLSYYMGEALGG